MNENLPRGPRRRANQGFVSFTMVIPLLVAFAPPDNWRIHRAEAASIDVNEAVAGGSVASSLMEQLETTDQTGQTTGTVEELTQIGETMSSATASVLSGLVKLDECVDTDENYVLVELGWKPSLSQAAREVRSDLSGVATGKDDEKKEPKKVKTTTQIVPSDGYRKKSKLKDDF